MTIFNQAKNYKDQSETLLFRLCICLIYFVGKEYLKQKKLERTTAQYLPCPKTHKSNILSTTALERDSCSSLFSRFFLTNHEIVDIQAHVRKNCASVLKVSKLLLRTSCFSKNIPHLKIVKILLQTDIIKQSPN